MKMYKAISLLGLFGVVGNAYSVQMTPQIQKLLDQKAQKVAELEKCDKTRKGFMIAGISTLGLTAVGVGGNIALANKNKQLDVELTSKKSELASKKKELSLLQSRQIVSADVDNISAYKSTDSFGTISEVVDYTDINAISLTGNEVCAKRIDQNGQYGSCDDPMFSELEYGQWGANTSKGLAYGYAVCSSQSESAKMTQQPAENGNNCWCKLVGGPTWVKAQNTKDCGRDCANQCLTSFVNTSAFRTSLSPAAAFSVSTQVVESNRSENSASMATIGQIKTNIAVNAGSDYACFNHTDSRSIGAEALGVELNKDEWAVKFDYGVVRGTSACSKTVGDKNGFTENEQEYVSGGEYCWCKLVVPTGSNWVARGKLDDVNAPGTAAIYCPTACAHACAYNFAISEGFRKPFVELGGKPVVDTGAIDAAEQEFNNGIKFTVKNEQGIPISSITVNCKSANSTSLRTSTSGTGEHMIDSQLPDAAECEISSNGYKSVTKKVKDLKSNPIVVLQPGQSSQLSSGIFEFVVVDTNGNTVKDITVTCNDGTAPVYSEKLTWSGSKYSIGFSWVDSNVTCKIYSSGFKEKLITLQQLQSSQRFVLEAEEAVVKPVRPNPSSNGIKIGDTEQLAYYGWSNSQPGVAKGFNVSLNKGEWAVLFDYGLVKGTAACTSNEASSLGFMSKKSEEKHSARGKYCWCKMESIDDAPWVSKWVSVQHTYDTTAKSCLTLCPLECAAAFFDKPNFRLPMFNSVAK